MTTVLLQHPLAPEEIRDLQREFPTCDFVLYSQLLTEKEWQRIEILYGSRLSAQELGWAHRLRWIHVPTASLDHLCVREIEETTNLLVTNTKDPDVHQWAEFAIGTMLAFGKNLYTWHDLQKKPHELKESPARDLMWSFKGRTLLQVGLGPVGSAILQLAQQLQMRTWGVGRTASFHPYCQKTFETHELHSLLPAVDVLSIAIPRGEPIPLLFKEQQLDLLKNDSILLILGSRGVVDEEALAKLALSERLRGIAIDGLLPKSPLVQMPQVLVTPEVAPLPEPTARLEFRQFHHNFRRYIHNDFTGMKNLLRMPALEY